jgi:hypothetical protein
MGANDRCPMPHAAKGWPVDDVATVVVRFSPIVRSPARPLPILRAIVFVIVIVFIVVVVIIKKALPIIFPPPPSPSCPVIIRDRMPARIPAEASTCMTPGPRTGCRSQGRPYCRPTMIPFKQSPPSALPLPPVSSSSLRVWVEGGSGMWEGGICVVCCMCCVAQVNATFMLEVKGFSVLCPSLMGSPPLPSHARLFSHMHFTLDACGLEELFFQLCCCVSFLVSGGK